MKKIKVGDLVKLKVDKSYVHHWNNPQKILTLPAAGMVVEVKIDSWVHPYYGMSKHFEQKEIEIEVAVIKWFEYEIPNFGISDNFNVKEYNERYGKMPLKKLTDFSKYLDTLKKKKGLYK